MTAEELQEAEKIEKLKKKGRLPIEKLLAASTKAAATNQEAVNNKKREEIIDQLIQMGAVNEETLLLPLEELVNLEKATRLKFEEEARLALEKEEEKQKEAELQLRRDGINFLLSRGFNLQELSSHNDNTILWLYNKEQDQMEKKRKKAAREKAKEKKKEEKARDTTTKKLTKKAWMKDYLRAHFTPTFSKPFVLFDIFYPLTWVRGLYRGATPSFVGMAIESSLVFGIYSQTKQALQGGGYNRKPEPHTIIPSAAFAGSIISFVLCPSELVKCRMQIQGTDSVVSSYHKYNGPLNCAIETVKAEGVKGLFRGGMATLSRESVGNAVFFSTYEYLRHSLHLQVKDCLFDHKYLVDVGIGIVSGGLGGIAFWSAVLPLDVAKTIIQTSPDKNISKNPFKILQSVYRRSGLKGCYTGLGPTVSRAFPANAAAIVTYEAAAKLLGVVRE